MDEQRRSSTVVYTDVDESYFKERELRRYARALHLWGLGVGAVISGDFFGWNFGLAQGGFGGMLVATVVISLVYLALSFSIAEMSAALPHFNLSQWALNIPPESGELQKDIPPDTSIWIALSLWQLPIQAPEAIPAPLGRRQCGSSSWRLSRGVASEPRRTSCIRHDLK